MDLEIIRYEEVQYYASFGFPVESSQLRYLQGVGNKFSHKFLEESLDYSQNSDSLTPFQIKPVSLQYRLEIWDSKWEQGRTIFL